VSAFSRKYGPLLKEYSRLSLAGGLPLSTLRKGSHTINFLMFKMLPCSAGIFIGSLLLFQGKIFYFPVETWWNDWHDKKVDSFNFPVSNLEFNRFGCQCTLAYATYLVCIQTNISEIVHQKFSMRGLKNIKHFILIYMPNSTY
jgi:hypothetical protein